MHEASNWQIISSQKAIPLFLNVNVKIARAFDINKSAIVNGNLSITFSTLTSNDMKWRKLKVGVKNCIFYLTPWEFVDMFLIVMSFMAMGLLESAIV